MKRKMKRKITQETYRVIYKKKTSHQPEGWYGVAYVWANDREDARRVFLSNYNKVNNDGTWSSISYEILEVDSHDPKSIKIEQ